MDVAAFCILHKISFGLGPIDHFKFEAELVDTQLVLPRVVLEDGCEEALREDETRDQE